MAKSYLRQIILEEIKKVLKEQFQSKPGQTGMYDETPEEMDKQYSDYGKQSPKKPVDFTGDPLMITARKPDMKVRKLQQNLNKILASLGRKSIAVDGIMGEQTLAALVKTRIAARPGMSHVHPKDVANNIDSYLELSDKALTRTKPVSATPEMSGEEWRKPWDKDQEKKETPVNFKPSDMDELQELVKKALKRV